MPEFAQRPGRLKIGVVGAGRVGAVLAHALRNIGHEITAVSGQSPQVRERIEVLLPGVPIVDPDEVPKGTDLVLFTVPDDVLPSLIQGFTDLGVFSPGQLLVHTAGRYGLEVFEPAVGAGAIPIAIHPAMTFSGTSLDLVRIDGAPFAISASAAFLPIGQALVVEMGGEPITLPDEARETYHAALAHGANHLVTLVSQAKSILEESGVPEADKLLTPLLTAALEGALTFGDYALTGPIRRGDAGTVKAHLDALAVNHPHLLSTYLELARATMRRAVECEFLTDAQAMAIADVINGSPETPSEHHQGTRIIPTIAELHANMGTGTRGVVMTMGALHEGHLELVRQARAENEEVVVTIFVNPLQFGPGEDLDEYPRTFDEDVAKLQKLGVDIIFAPTTQEIYPHKRVGLKAGEMGEVLEGASRPGHFDGMLTVVNKLLSITKPTAAYFGQKDAQQLALIRAMVADLNIETTIRAVPIVRDHDGLALSSRNAYLDEQARTDALVIPRTIRAGQEVAAAGANAESTLQAARSQFAKDSENVELDYLVLVDPETMKPYDSSHNSPALLAIAAKVGNTRLLDNAVIEWQAFPSSGTTTPPGE